MIQKFQTILDNLLTFPLMKNNYVLGLSGGVDSVCLLNLLKKYIEQNNHINLFPIIIDHQIRKNSSIEAKKVKKYSEILGFKTKIKKIQQIPPEGNIQNWARLHRRNLLIKESISLNSNLILAHHEDDQIETLFMRLIKGSGFSGMLGMKKISEWEQVMIIRPLLSFKKNEVLHYVKEKAADVINDNIQMTLNIYKAMVEVGCDATIIQPFSNCSYPGIIDVQHEEMWWNGNIHESVESYGAPKKFAISFSKSAIT